MRFSLQHMTSVQRVEAAMRHQPPDRTPIFCYVLLSPVCDLVLGRPFVHYDEEPARWFAREGAVGREAALKTYARERLELARLLGHDLLYVCPAPLKTTAIPAPDAPDDPVKRLEARNKAARQAVAEEGSAFDVYGYLREEMAASGQPLCLFAPAYTLGIWSDVDLMETMLLEPEVAREHFDLAAQRACRLARIYAGYGVELVGVGGDFAGNRLMISPRLYREFIAPQVRRVAEAVRATGAWAVTASDGDVWDVLDDFLFAGGADAYMEIDSRAGMDMARLKRACGDKICLMGNLDCGELLSFASPETVRRETRRCLEEGAGEGGHIFTPSNAISATVPFANYRAMEDAYREFFGLAPIAWRKSILQ